MLIVAVFTKLASQLTADKLGELAIIPVIFAVQILVSYLCSIAMAKLFGFKKRPRNFVVAMGVRKVVHCLRTRLTVFKVFGNSNSLPISLVISLSQTIRGLHWSKIPGDNDDEVAARGILYLLIFQQLGQLVRWSWGYHVLLAPPDKFKDSDAHGISRLEQGFEPYLDPSRDEQERLIDDSPTDAGSGAQKTSRQLAKTGSMDAGRPGTQAINVCIGEDGERTPITHQTYTSSLSSKAYSDRQKRPEGNDSPDLPPTPANGNIEPSTPGKRNTLTKGIKPARSTTDQNTATGARGCIARCKNATITYKQSVSIAVRNGIRSLFHKLPHSFQVFVRTFASSLGKFFVGVWDFMNPPLWAMLAAIIVASIPSLQRLFFSEGTFVKNSITSAIRQMGGVAVPLILVVLGANLEGKTQPKDPNHSDDDDKEETKLLIASILSRMVLPILVMAPLLALAAKYVPVSILDDPIFIIVCFLLTGAPSALQLAQICQINGVYLGAMSRLLFQSYVVWLVYLFRSHLEIPNRSRILPSTLILVVCSIEVLEWAG